MKLPIGVQHFPKLREKGYLYVDKTELIYRLLKEGEGDFLSRPRRFGKSLLVSVFESIFQGKKDLFEGLWIFDSDYDWPVFPVISLDFSRVEADDKEELIDSLNELLVENAERLGVKISPGPKPSRTLTRLIQALNEPVVILVDEYDRPLLKHLTPGQTQDEIRNVMQDFFVVMKAMGAYLRYVFVTGVSKFSKVSLFSGMNNLRDLSLHPAYATLTGITEEELSHDYASFIERAAQKREVSEEQLRLEMRKWYNGYRFSPSSEAVKVYNPVSLHLFFEEARFSNYWFGTATPTFAMNLLKEQNYPVMDLENGIEMGSAIEEHHEVSRPNLIPLLFQTGYLTIADYNEKARKYLLKFPNEEVKLSFFDHLVRTWTDLDETQLGIHVKLLKNSLREGHLDDFFKSFNALMAEIPYSLHLEHEGYYHSLFYLLLRSLNVRVEAETMTSRGRLDLIVFFPDQIYLFEFKINGSAKAALNQIIEKGYADRYSQSGKKVTLIGVNFDCKTRAVSEWKVGI